MKGALLVGVGFGLLRLLHRDVGEMIEDIVNKLRGDPDNRYLGSVLSKLSLLDDKKIEQLSTLTFVYGALFFTEGTGLYFEKNGRISYHRRYHVLHSR